MTKIVNSILKLVCRPTQMPLLGGRSIAALLACLNFVMMFSAQAFVHPGIPLTVSDLASLKSNLTNAPWASGYAALVSSGYSSTNYTMQGPFAYVSRNEGGTGTNINLNQWNSDMQAVYCQSLMWYFTSNTVYAQKAHDILMAWANTQTNFGGYEASFQVGGSAYRYLTGADILRGTWPGWTTSDTTNLQRFFTNAYWPCLGVPAPVTSASQGGEGIMGAIAISIFCDDTNRLNQALSALLTDADSGFRDTYANGEEGDTWRDQGHSFLYLFELGWPAEVLWKQGIDVFSIYDNRILATTEYWSRYNLPGSVPPFVPLGAPFTSTLTTNIGGAPRSTTQPRMTFNIVRGAYGVRQGLSTPWTTLFCNDQVEDMESFVYRKSADTSTATPATVLALPATASLTTGLIGADLNGATPAGSSSYSGGTWTLRGGYNNKDPWNNASDSIRFAYKQVTGDFVMLAQVTSVSSVGSSSAKAGIMLRDSLGTVTNRAWVAITPGTNYERAVWGWTNLPYGANNAQMAVGGMQMPYWVKMERVGDRVQMFTSPNGADWSPACTSDFTTGLPDTMYVGLFDLSFVSGTLNTATFANVRLTGGDGGEAAKTPPAPFSILAAPGDAQVPLRWNPAFNAAAYNVKRSLNSGSGYATIATVTNTIYTDTNVVNGTTYYYVATAQNTAGESGNSLEDSVTPQLTLLNVATGGAASASSDYAGGGQSALQAFDLNPGTKWFNNNAGTNGWLQYDFGPTVRQTVLQYAVTSAGDTAGRDPQNWQLLASNDGLTWTNLDAQSNQAFAYRYQTVTYSTGSTNCYRYYRLNVTANNGDASGLQLSELALLAAPGTAATVTAPSPQLRAYLTFNESSGTSAADATGNGWTGTFVNGPTFVAGYSNNAVSLSSGSSQYVTLPTGVVSNLNDFTIACWVKQTSSSQWARIFDFGAGTGTYMFLCPASGGAAPSTVRFGITTGSNGGEKQINGTTTLPAGSWQHVAVTLAGNVGILYVNGVAVGTNSAITQNPSSLGATTQNYLGKSQWSDPYFNGMVDEFRIYNGALSAGEVATFLTPLTAPTGLVAAAGDAAVSLNWNAVANARSYNVFRSQTNGGPYSLVANVATTGFTNTGLANGTNYYFVVAATNAVTASGNSAQVSVRPTSHSVPQLGMVSGAGQLQFNWPADHTGWRLQVQTNPLSNGLGTNWSTVANSTNLNQTTLPISTTNGSVFFRLTYP